MHLTLLDGSGYIYRAFHAVPRMKRSDGADVNAVYGFCFMLKKLIKNDRSTHLAVVFDKGKRTFRHDIYPEYKANRSAPLDYLVSQFPLVREAVEAFNVSSVEQEGFEADDLIATYTRLATEAGWSVTIVSSDKDLMQLVTESVSMYDPMKDKKIGPEEVFDKFGVMPDNVVDVQALVGDATDNIPGVNGIGQKTASKLIQDFGSLENLLENLGAVSQPKTQSRLKSGAKIARLSKRLVTLETRVPVDVGINDFVVRNPNNWKLQSFLNRMEFFSLANEVPAGVNPLDEPIGALNDNRI